MIKEKKEKNMERGMRFNNKIREVFELALNASFYLPDYINSFLPGTKHLSLRLRELIFFKLSKASKATICESVHKRVGKLMGLKEEVFEGLELLSEKEKVALSFAFKVYGLPLPEELNLTSPPSHYFTQDEIEAIIAVTMVAKFVNTLSKFLIGLFQPQK